MVRFLNGKKIDLSFVQAFEKKFDLKLPRGFVDIVLESDGALMTDSSVVVFDPERKREEIFSCSQLHNFGRGKIDYINSGQFEHLPERVVFFGVTGGGDQFGLDYRDKTRAEPSVVLYIHHNPDDTDIVPIAENFDEFISKMFRPDYDK